MEGRLLFFLENVMSEYFIQDAWNQHQMARNTYHEVKTSEPSQHFCRIIKSWIFWLDNNVQGLNP